MNKYQEALTRLSTIDLREYDKGGLDHLKGTPLDRLGRLYACDCYREEFDTLLELVNKEEKYKWHDLRKDPNDLPKENGLYLVILLPPNKELLFRKIELIVYSDLMGICKEKHWNNGRVGSDDYENYDKRVIAWKCIDIGVIFEDE